MYNVVIQHGSKKFLIVLWMYVFGGILSRILPLFSFLVPALDPGQTSLYYLNLVKNS